MAGFDLHIIGWAGQPVHGRARSRDGPVGGRVPVAVSSGVPDHKRQHLTGLEGFELGTVDAPIAPGVLAEEPLPTSG